MDRRRCQFKAACDAEDDRAIQRARVHCPCWRCDEWRAFAATPAFKRALIDGYLEGLLETDDAFHA